MKTIICKSGPNNLKSGLEAVWRWAVYLKLILSYFLHGEVPFSTLPVVVLKKKKWLKTTEFFCY